MGSQSEGTTETRIGLALDAVTPHQWRELQENLAGFQDEAVHAVWTAGRDNLDDEGRVVHTQGFWSHSDAVEALVQQLYELDLIVPFDWMCWAESHYRRYQLRPVLPTEAPVVDVIRVLVTIVRGERFADGTLQSACRDGLLEAALERLHDWYETNRGTPET